MRQVGLDFDVVPSEVKEDFVDGESPQDHAMRLAGVKARKVGETNPNRWVIGADTVVSIDGRILGKPRTDREAYEMLSMLSGRDHLVITGVSVIRGAKGNEKTIAVETSVRIKTLNPAEINWYINTGEPFDKAGGYAIQGRGAFMVQRIEGSYTNVVGLPLCGLLEVLDHPGDMDLSKR